MKLIVGLGNPGKQYEITRHNAGFIIINYLSEYLKSPLSKSKFNGLYTKLTYENEDIILLTPLTYMNLSGDCIIQFINYFKIDVKDVLIIHDEIDLPFGKIQFKNNGSPAGHNGLKDIFNKLKTNGIARLRVGVGKDKNIPIINWVLTAFSYQELLSFNNNQKLVIDAILTWISNNNFNLLMTKFNNQFFS